ncbi:SDR family NAD(P)-dependent oxidoreductase, partial [Chloroflexota bacterium]
MRLKDKVVIVTGGARGLGREYALQFSSEGAKVAVCDVLDCGETAKEIESKGGEVLSLETDVSSEKSTIEMAQKTAERFGGIDILVNNAAIYGGIQPKPFYEFTV